MMQVGMEHQLLLLPQQVATDQRLILTMSQSFLQSAHRFLIWEQLQQDAWGQEL